MKRKIVSRKGAGRISIEFSLFTTLVYKASLPCHTITGVGLPHPEKNKPLENGGILNWSISPEKGPGKPVEFRVVMVSSCDDPDSRLWSVQSVKCLDEGIHYPSQKLPFFLGITEESRKKWVHYFGWAPKPATELIRKHCESIRAKAREEKEWQVAALAYFRQFNNSTEYLKRKAKELSSKSDAPNRYRARTAWWGFEKRKASSKKNWKREGFAPSRSKNKRNKSRESRDLFTPLRAKLKNV